MKRTNKGAHRLGNLRGTPGKPSVRRAFTLIELSLAMGILALIMLVMMQFFIEAQKAWTGSYNRAEVFDNAAIAMDLISRDLQCAYYKYQDTTHYTPFEISTSGTTCGMKFYSTTPYPPNTECTSPICEVEYEWDSSDSEGWLKRRAVGNRAVDAAGTETDNTTSGGGNWNGPPPDMGSGDPFANNSTTQERDIIPYITSLELTKYDKNGATITTNNTPYIVKIKLSLVTKDVYDKWVASGNDDVKKRYERTFTKFVVIGDRGQE